MRVRYGMFNGLNRNDIIGRIRELDKEMGLVGQKGQILIVGGSAMAIHGFGRFTEDIDIIGDLKHIKSDVLDRLSIDTNVGSVMVIPDLQDVSVEELKGFANLSVYVLSVEDLALAKLFTERLKDEQDLLEYLLPSVYDFEGLRQRIEEYMPYLPTASRDLNARSWSTYLEKLKDLKRIVVVSPDDKLGNILGRLRVRKRVEQALIEQYGGVYKGKTKSLIVSLMQTEIKDLRGCNIFYIILKETGWDIRC